MTTPESDEAIASILRRLEALEAAVFRIQAHVESLSSDAQRDHHPNTVMRPSGSARSRRRVLSILQQAIAAGGGQATLSTSDIARRVALHQTHVAAILRKLEADGIIASAGRRVRTYRLPDRAVRD